jgi:hypothetical protein
LYEGIISRWKETGEEQGLGGLRVKGYWMLIVWGASKGLIFGLNFFLWGIFNQLSSETRKVNL